MDFNMKKIITLALIIGATTFTQAQGNLVFNQVLNFNIDTGSSVTVPEGKVWKIVSGVTQGNVQFYSTNQDYGNDLDASNSNSYSIQSFEKPFWLGQGNTMARISGSGQAIFCILEFNVVAISSGGGGGSGGGVSADGFTTSGIINLEFSGTNSSGNLGTITDLGNLTVPEGKIWKLGSYSFSIASDLDSNTFGSGYGGTLLVDGFYVSSTNPLYLSAGTYQVTGKSSASGGGGIYYIVAKLGGLEYNAN